jgi:hypothetical protein
METKRVMLSALQANANLRGRLDAIVTLTHKEYPSLSDMWDTFEALFDEVEGALITALNGESNDQ